MSVHQLHHRAHPRRRHVFTELQDRKHQEIRRTYGLEHGNPIATAGPRKNRTSRAITANLVETVPISPRPPRPRSFSNLEGI